MNGEQTVCPRCGARDSFMKGYLPDTCVCRVCQSQLDWREIPVCGPDCAAATVPHDKAAPVGRAPVSEGGRPGGAGNARDSDDGSVDA